MQAVSAAILKYLMFELQELAIWVARSIFFVSDLALMINFTQSLTFISVCFFFLVPFTDISAVRLIYSQTLSSTAKYRHSTI